MNVPVIIVGAGPTGSVKIMVRRSTKVVPRDSWVVVIRIRIPWAAISRRASRSRSSASTAGL